MTRHRARFDPLAPTDAPRWLVESDLWRNPLGIRYLAPGTDLRAALQAAIADRQADGWQPECAGAWGFTFIHRAGGERRMVGVQAQDPQADHPVGTYSRQPA